MALMIHAYLYTERERERHVASGLSPGTGKSTDFPDGWHENLAVRLTQKYGLAYDVAQHLARNYGALDG